MSARLGSDANRDALSSARARDPALAPRGTQFDVEFLSFGGAGRSVYRVSRERLYFPGLKEASADARSRLAGDPDYKDAQAFQIFRGGDLLEIFLAPSALQRVGSGG
jgi:hypothetical protein